MSRCCTATSRAGRAFEHACGGLLIPAKDFSNSCPLAALDGTVLAYHSALLTDPALRLRNKIGRYSHSMSCRGANSDHAVVILLASVQGTVDRRALAKRSARRRLLPRRGDHKAADVAKLGVSFGKQ